VAPTLLILGQIGYGLIPIGLLWTIFYYPDVRYRLMGIFLHMLVVAIKQALLVAYPQLIMFDWIDIHRATAILAGLCLLYGMRKK
jgi:hypothetical protein